MYIERAIAIEIMELAGGGRGVGGKANVLLYLTSAGSMARAAENDD